MNPMEYVSPEPYKLYINGQYVAAEKGNIVDVINPANNQPFAKVYRGTKEDCEKAIQAARKAFDEGPWSKMSAKERSKLLLKAARILERRRNFPSSSPGMRQELRRLPLLGSAYGSGCL